MALVDVVSFRLIDADGDSKTLPVYIPSGDTLANITTFAQAMGAAIDDASGCLLDAISVTVNVALPGGIKGAATAGSEVQKGALLSFDAADTNYKQSYYVPGWNDAGFSGNAVNATGVYDTLIDLFVTTAGIDATDRDGNDLTAYIAGVKKFRK
jgi:hypothetical protein